MSKSKKSEPNPDSWLCRILGHRYDSSLVVDKTTIHVVKSCCRCRTIWVVGVPKGDPLVAEAERIIRPGKDND